jgi:hypothetical protein
MLKVNNFDHAVTKQISRALIYVFQVELRVQVTKVVPARCRKTVASFLYSLLLTRYAFVIED